MRQVWQHVWLLGAVLLGSVGIGLAVSLVHGTLLHALLDGVALGLLLDGAQSRWVASRGQPSSSNSSCV